MARMVELLFFMPLGAVASGANIEEMIYNERDFRKFLENQKIVNYLFIINIDSNCRIISV